MADQACVGAVVSATDGSGSVFGTYALSASAASASVGSGALRFTWGMVGSAGSTSSTTAVWDIFPAVATNGTANARTSGEGQVYGTYSLIGSAGSTSSGAGVAAVSRAIIGVAASSSTALGELYLPATGVLLVGVIGGTSSATSFLGGAKEWFAGASDASSAGLSELSFVWRPALIRPQIKSWPVPQWQ